MRLEVTPRHLDVAPGEPVTLAVEVYNTRDVIDGFGVSLVGVPGQPFTATPDVLSLFPDTEGVMTVAFVLPTGFPAGPRTIGVKVASTTEPDETQVAEVDLEVAAVRDVRVTLDPQSVTGARRAAFVVTLENGGNVAVEAPLSAVDAERHLTFSFLPDRLAVGPGERQVSQATATGKRPLVGSPVPRPFTVRASDAGGPPLETVGSFVQKPWLPRGLLTLLSVLAAVALWGLVLLLAVDKAVKSGVDAAEEGADGEAAAGPAQPGGGGGAGAGAGGLGTISGVVVAGADPAGALVSVAPLAAGAAPGRGPVPTSVGPGGRFEFGSLATPASYKLGVAKVGFGSQVLVVDLGPGENKTVDVRLLNGDGGIWGRVTDGRNPLGDVAVTAVSGADKASVVSQATEPVGDYAVLRLPTPATYVVTFAKKGYGSESIVVELAPGQVVPERNVVLRQGNGSISGTVADHTGLPIADVAVVASRAGSPVGRTTSLGTGSVGFFAVGGLPTPGTYTLEFSKEGFLSETRNITLGEAGNVTDANPRLNPVTATISGLVTEQVVRAPACGPLECPLDNVDVTVTDAKGAEVKSTSTASFPPDQRGRYSIVGIPAGDYTATYAKDGYVSQTVRLTVAANEQRAIDRRLIGQSGAISGNAEQCARVDVVLNDGSPLTPPATARARASGDYQFPRMATKGEYVLLFRDSGGAVDQSIALNLGPGEKLAGIDGACTPPPPPTTTTTIRCLLGTYLCDVPS